MTLALTSIGDRTIVTADGTKRLLQTSRTGEDGISALVTRRYYNRRGRRLRFRRDKRHRLDRCLNKSTELQACRCRGLIRMHRDGRIQRRLSKTSRTRAATSYRRLSFPVDRRVAHWSQNRPVRVQQTRCPAGVCADRPRQGNERFAGASPLHLPSMCEQGRGTAKNASVNDSGATAGLMLH